MYLGIYMKLALTILASTAALTLSTQAFSAGQIKFTGEIVNAACNIAVDGNPTGEVMLGKWPTSTFKVAGDKSSPKPFTLKVTDCAAGSYNFHFEGLADSVNKQLLKASSAQGVGIAIANADSMTNLVNINTVATSDTNASITLGKDEQEGSLPLQAFYQATGELVTAGQANATARVTIEQK